MWCTGFFGSASVTLDLLFVAPISVKFAVPTLVFAENWLIENLASLM